MDCYRRGPLVFPDEPVIPELPDDIAELLGLDIDDFAPVRFQAFRVVEPLTLISRFNLAVAWILSPVWLLFTGGTMPVRIRRRRPKPGTDFQTDHPLA